MAALGSAGLSRDMGGSVYEMHPLLTSYLRSRGEAPEACRRAFVDVMGSVADALTPRQWHEQRGPFLLHGANIHHARVLSRRLGMEQDFLALTQSLARWAQNSRNFAEASRLFRELAEYATARENRELEAVAYHQLGRIAEEERDFGTAREWYLKSLAIKEKQGNLQRAAITYHQLGSIAEEERDFGTAREWYLKSLAIEEKQGNQHGAALTYAQLGLLSREEGRFAESGGWLIRALAVFVQTQDNYRAQRAAAGFSTTFQQASDQEKENLRQLWQQANLGPFPQ